MKKHSIAICFLAALLLLTLLYPNSAHAAETETPFSGSRTVVLTADMSDLRNFFEGGREALDLLLRYNAPSWLTYSLRSQDRDVILSLHFSFSSLDEYTTRLSVLLNRTPNILYTYYNGIILTEDFSAIELLNFLAASMDLSESETDWALDQIFHVTGNTLELNAETYEFGAEPLCLTPQANGTILLQDLKVETEEADDGTLTRTITVKTGGSGFDKTQWDALLQRFQQIGQTESHSDTTGQSASVTFVASDSQTMAQHTGFCLNTAVNVTQTVTDISGFTMNIHRTELFLLEGLMAEDGIFRYCYSHPSSCQELTALSEMTEVSDTTVTATGQSCIQTGYQQTFGLSKITVETDYSNLFGKIRRTITLSAPSQAAAQFHPILKAELTKRLIPGTSLDIFDQDGMRCYTLQFSAWFDEDIATFTQSILGITTYSRTDSWLPYGESRVNESITSTRLLSGMESADALELRYHFSDFAIITVDEALAHKAGSTLTFSGSEATVSYRHLHLGKLIPEVLAVILVLLLLLIPTVRLFRKLKAIPKPRAAKRPSKIPNEKPTQIPAEKPAAIPAEKPATPAPRFCKKCGKPIIPGKRFCTACGNPVDS